jgi:hypothetical protein
MDGWMDGRKTSENFFSPNVSLFGQNLWNLERWKLGGFWMRICGRLFTIKPPL